MKPYILVVSVYEAERIDVESIEGLSLTKDMLIERLSESNIKKYNIYMISDFVEMYNDEEINSDNNWITWFNMEDKQ